MLRSIQGHGPHFMHLRTQVAARAAAALETEVSVDDVELTFERGDVRSSATYVDGDLVVDGTYWRLDISVPECGSEPHVRLVRDGNGDVVDA